MLGTERLQRKTCPSAAPTLTASPKAAWPVASSLRGLAQPARPPPALQGPPLPTAALQPASGPTVTLVCCHGFGAKGFLISSLPLSLIPQRFQSA